MLLAYSYPDDCQMRTLHLPLEIGIIRIDPTVCGKIFNSAVPADHRQEGDQMNDIAVDAIITHFHQKGATPVEPGGFTGDVTIFDPTSSHVAVQAQGIKVVPFGDDNTEYNDRVLFTKMQLVDMDYDGTTAATQVNDTMCTNARTIRDALDRLANFYLREFDLYISGDDPLRLATNTSGMAYYLQYGRHKLSSANPDQLVDTFEDVQSAVEPIATLPDVGIMTLVGENLSRVARGEKTMLEIFRETSILERFYERGFAAYPSACWQAEIVKQLVDRNPHMNIIEVGAGTGGTTKRIFQSIGSKFRSYTFTDISTGFFGTASTVLSSFSDRTIFKTLDLESDPCSQGFRAYSYDVVIASFVLHATTSLRCTLARIRTLLKPGGLLIVGEVSVNSPLLSFIFGLLPGWWSGRNDEGRVHSPAVPVARWHQLLLDSNFSGLDTRSPMSWEDDLGVVLFASQAVDDSIRLLRNPSQYSQIQACLVKDIIVVGANSAETKLLGRNLQAFFQQICIKVWIFPSLAAVDYNIVTLNTASPVPIISIVDLDKPIMEDITEDNFNAFRRMLELGRNILWVTSNRLSNNPFSNMVVGFGRTAMNEIAALRIHYLDFETPFAPSVVKVISETTLRFALAPTLAKGKSKGDILWTDEPEIFVNDSGKHRVPRLMPLPELNCRYNSRRRYTLQSVSITEIPVLLCCDQRGAMSLEKLQVGKHSGTKHPAGLIENTSQLCITHAIFPAIRTSLGYRFLIIGVDERKTPHLALVTSIVSIMTVRARDMVPFPDCHLSEASLLSILAAQLVASEIIMPLRPGQTVLIHEATRNFIQAIRTQADQKCVDVVFSVNQNSSTQVKSVPSVKTIVLQPYLSNADLWQILPTKANIDSFVNLAEVNERDSIGTLIMQSLPASCRKEAAGNLYTWVCGKVDTDGADNAAKILKMALESTQTFSSTTWEEFEVVSLSNLISDVPPSHVGNGGLRVVDLTGSTQLPVRVMRLDTNKQFLKPDRTYWIVGLSGALGVSLCDWMIDVGACHIVVSSRKPALEPLWIEAHCRRGANIIVMPCDITNYEALAAVHAHICDNHPPIAGVLNGAMVLRDVIIGNMTFSQFCDVQGPKVTGSLYLDRIFSSNEFGLDFFVLLSSINFIVGNPGQANYAAANAFQCSLVSKRRRRGLPGVALNVGAIIGAGYLRRTDMRKLGLPVQRGGLMHLSEEDFHQIIAEGILASHPYANSNDGSLCELTTGLLTVAHDTVDPPIWFADPKFTHLIVTHRDQTDDFRHMVVSNDNFKENTSRITVSVFQDQLRACTKPSELETVVKKAFAAQLRYTLQSHSTVDDELLMMFSDELGIDSLTSVDIRNWFQKFMMVSIPVLRIMSKITMLSLVQYAIENKPAEIAPQIPLNPHILLEDERNLPPQEMNRGQAHQTSNLAPIPQATLTRTLINWDTETLPPTGPDDLRALLQSHSTYTEVAAVPPEKIVLTGATGLLGRHLLRHLLQATPSTTKIVSIAVRQLQTFDLETFLATLPLEIRSATSSGQISFLAGDLSQPRLGLTPTDCAAVFANADAVIHAGADTSHIKPYSALRDSNVGSTRELVRLCEARRGVALHFVSSAGIGLFSPRDDTGKVNELLPARATGVPPTADGEGILANSGYTASKWAAERLLERVAATARLRIWIHRPSTILRLGADAHDERGRLDWLNQLVLYARALKAVPQVKYVEGGLDIVHVRSVCESIVRCVLQSTGTNNAMISYVHEVGDAVVPLDNMEGLLDLQSDDTLTDGGGTI
ncbi:hypothetical protein F4777DRAFT_262151 [Nemania sp. FL0916]|nr:hypothetical protein F4777DRAFT_262151 [Nemania sp. FL0916]